MLTRLIHRIEVDRKEVLDPIKVKNGKVDYALVD